MKYRKKPVVVEAMRFEEMPNKPLFGSLKSAQEISEWSGGKVQPVHYHPVDGWCARLMVNTLEGQMQANAGDYIIKGIKGEFYPCKPDIFEKTYELVDEKGEVKP
jgi:hypothetical protein